MNTQSTATPRLTSKLVVNVCVEANAQFPSDVRRDHRELDAPRTPSGVHGLLRFFRTSGKSCAGVFPARKQRAPGSPGPRQPGRQHPERCRGGKERRRQPQPECLWPAAEYERQQKAITDRQNQEQFAKDDAEADESLPSSCNRSLMPMEI